MSIVSSFSLEIQPTLVIKDPEGVIIARSFDPEQNIPAFIEATASNEEQTGLALKWHAIVAAPLMLAIGGVTIYVGESSADKFPVMGHSLSVVGGLGGAALGIFSFVDGKRQHARYTERALGIRKTIPAPFRDLTSQ